MGAASETRVFDDRIVVLRDYGMRIRLLTSPPVFIHHDGTGRMIDINYTGGVGRITATALDVPAATIYLSNRDDCPDPWRAWRVGFPVDRDPAVQELARHLVQHQLAVSLEER
jgi:hypothetical protein